MVVYRKMVSEREDVSPWVVYKYTKGERGVERIDVVQAQNQPDAISKAAERYPELDKPTREYPIGRLIVRPEGDTSIPVQETVETFYHGTNKAPEVIREGFALEAPRVQDPGDLGWGVYLTQSQSRARTQGENVLKVSVDDSDILWVEDPYFVNYAPQTEGERLYYDLIVVEDPDPREPHSIPVMGTIRGTQQERVEVAKRVREGMRKAGYQGVMGPVGDDIEVCLYTTDPILSIELLEGLEEAEDISVATGTDPEMYTDEALEDFTEEQIEGHVRYDVYIGDESVGYALTVPALKGDSVWIRALYVDPDYRGQGIAGELVDVVLEDNYGREILVQPLPFKDEPLDVDELTQVYQHWGFERIEDPTGEGRVILSLEPREDIKEECLSYSKGEPVSVRMRKGESVSRKLYEQDVEGRMQVGDVVFDQEEGWGADPSNANIRYEGFVIWIYPKQFLGLVPKRVGRENLRDIEDHIRGGGTIGSPSLFAKWDEDLGAWKVWSHEGRGRTLAIDEIQPHTKIPVHVFPYKMNADSVTTEMARSYFIPDEESGLGDFKNFWVKPSEVVLESHEGERTRAGGTEFSGELQGEYEDELQALATQTMRKLGRPLSPEERERLAQRVKRSIVKEMPPVRGTIGEPVPAGRRFESLQESKHWEDELAPYVDTAECYEVIKSIADRFSQLEPDSGFYVGSNGYPADHAWLVDSETGAIVDPTFGQFDPNTSVLVAMSGTEEFDRYYSWDLHHNPTCLHKLLGVPYECEVCGYKESVSESLQESLPTDEEVYRYQDATPERIVHGRWERATLRMRLENAGDILRELTNDPFSPGYIQEKIDKINKFLLYADGRTDPLYDLTREEHYERTSQDDAEQLQRLIDAYENQPARTEQQLMAKELVLALAHGDFKEAEYRLEDLQFFIDTMDRHEGRQVPLEENMKYRKPRLNEQGQYALDVSIPADVYEEVGLDIEDWFLGKKPEASGTGFGYRDLTWFFDSEQAASDAAADLRSGLEEAGISVIVNPSEGDLDKEGCVFIGVDELEQAPEPAGSAKEVGDKILDLLPPRFKGPRLSGWETGPGVPKNELYFSASNKGNKRCVTASVHDDLSVTAIFSDEGRRPEPGVPKWYREERYYEPGQEEEVAADVIGWINEEFDWVTQPDPEFDWV